MNKRILLLDDDFSVRESLADILEENGYVVTQAEKGLEAVGMAQEGKFDAAILDLKLPDIEGTEVAERILKISPQTYIVIMTGYATLDVAANALKNAKYIHLFKPVHPEQLLGILKNRLEGEE